MNATSIARTRCGAPPGVYGSLQTRLFSAHPAGTCGLWVVFLSRAPRYGRPPIPTSTELPIARRRQVVTTAPTAPDPRIRCAVPRPSDFAAYPYFGCLQSAKSLPFGSCASMRFPAKSPALAFQPPRWHHRRRYELRAQFHAPTWRGSPRAAPERPTGSRGVQRWPSRPTKADSRLPVGLSVGDPR